jgi:hypothetical protein
MVLFFTRFRRYLNESGSPYLKYFEDHLSFSEATRFIRPLRWVVFALRRDEWGERFCWAFMSMDEYILDDHGYKLCRRTVMRFFFFGSTLVYLEKLKRMGGPLCVGFYGAISSSSSIQSL